MPVASQEELEMAMQVIESSFQVSLADASAHNVHGGTLDDWEASSAGACAPAPGALETSSGSRGEAKLSEEEEGEGELPPLTFSEEDERRAEELKADGNEALKNGRYQRAEELYSEAIALVSTGKNSHIYFACVGGGLHSAGCAGLRATPRLTRTRLRH